MTKDEVTTVWKCKARYLSTVRQSSRILSFPDGRKRFITLKNWHWEVFDRLKAEKGWRNRELENSVYQVAIRHHSDKGQDFEDFLRQGILYLIKINMAYVMTEEGDWLGCNDN